MVTKVDIMTEATGQSEIQEFPDCHWMYDPELREVTILDLDNAVVEVFPRAEQIIRIVTEFWP